MKIRKIYKNNIKLYNICISYNLKEAYNIIAKMIPARFNESIDVSISLKYDSKTKFPNNDISLPHSNGKKMRILLLIDNGDDNNKLKTIYKVNDIGGPLLIKKILEKDINLKYNYIVTTPKMFPQLKPIAKILGPKGLMPTVKNETITDNIQETIKNIHKGKMTIKPSKNGTINMSIGRRSFTYQQIYENFKVLYNSIAKMKLSNIKGTYIKNIFISTTMSPGVRLNLNKI